MPIELTENALRFWSDHLTRHFEALRDRFSPEVHHDPRFQAVSELDVGETIRLKELKGGAEVLDVVEQFIDLATRKPESEKGCEAGTKSGGMSTTVQDRENIAGSSSDSVFSSLQLNNPESEIRLIRLLPGSDEEPITAEVFIAGTPGGLIYEALSYVWSSQNPDVSATVNGKKVEISANLAAALQCLRPHHDDAGDARLFWVDALCINQACLVEKAAQLALMGEIYRRASDVLIFLGEERDDSAMVMRYLDLYDEPAPAYSANISVRQNEVHQKVHARIIRYGFDRIRFLRAIDAFFKRPWWMRIWVVQEYALATQEPRVHCGRRWVRTTGLSSRLSELFNYLHLQSAPMAGNLSVLADPHIDAGSQWLLMPERRYNVNHMLVMDPVGPSVSKNLFSIMIHLLHRRSTDPRDRIFAVREMLDPICKQTFRPDYSITADYLFRKVSAFMLLQFRAQRAVLPMFHLSKSSDLPSWVLDFAKPFCRYTSLFMPQTAPWAEEAIAFPIYDRVLSVRGTLVDTLDLVFPLEHLDDDMQLMRVFWWLEGLVQKHRPSQDLPDTAKPLVPDKCLIPISPLKELLEGTSSQEVLSLFFPMTLVIPGYPFVGPEAIRAFSLITPEYEADNLTCENWQETPSTIGFDQESRIRGNLNEALYAMGAESFLGGACFDLANLKAQIQGFRLSVCQPRDSGDSDEPENVKGNGQTSNESSDNVYCPTYTHIKAALRDVQNEARLKLLKDDICSFADFCAAMVERYLRNPSQNGAAVHHDLTNLIATRHEANMSSCRKIVKNCSCIYNDREKHCSTVESRIREAGKIRQAMDNRVETLLKMLAEVNPCVFKPGYKMTISKMRSLSSVFVSRRGFVGITFQRQPDFKKGDQLALLDGMLAPMVIEKAGTAAGSYRMKGTAHVIGIEDVDIDGLVQLGVWLRRNIRII